MSRRDSVTEHEVLAAAERHARRGDGDWSRRVLERVDRHGADVASDLPDHLSLAEVLGELREEALDLGGWTLMAVHLARERGLPEHATARLRHRLEIVAGLGALADELLARALLELPRGSA